MVRVIRMLRSIRGPGHYNQARRQSSLGNRHPVAIAIVEDPPWTGSLEVGAVEALFSESGGKLRVDRIGRAES